MKNLIFNQKGQSLVEMALVLPLLLLLLLGIMEGGRIIGGYMELQSAARDVTRYAAIHKEVNTSGEIIPLVKKRFTLLDPNQMTADTVKFLRTESDNKKDMWVEVTLDYKMDMMTPFFSSSPFNLKSKMVMRVE